MNLSRHLPRLICNTILIVMAVLGTVFCVSSAFALQVSVFPLVLITILSGAVFSACFLEKKLFIGVLPALAAVFFLGSLTGLFAGAGPSMQQLAQPELCHSAGS